MKNKEILEMPLGKFAGIKVASHPYLVISRLCGADEISRNEKSDHVLVKNIVNLSPRHIGIALSKENLHTDNHRSVLKTLDLVRKKLIDAGFTKKFSFLKSPYFVTQNSSNEDWESIWVEVYGLTTKESKKLTELLKKVKYSVPQTYSPVLSNL